MSSKRLEILCVSGACSRVVNTPTLCESGVQATAGADSSLTLIAALSDLLGTALQQQQQAAVAAAIHSCPIWLDTAFRDPEVGRMSDTEGLGHSMSGGASLPAPFLRGAPTFAHVEVPVYS